MLLIDDPSVDSVDALWESLCSQVIFESSDPTNLDARIVRHTQVVQLQADIDKLTRDHQRAKKPRSNAMRSSPSFIGQEAARGTEHTTGALRSESQSRASELVEPAQNRTFAQGPWADFDLLDVKRAHDLINHQATADNLICALRRDAPAMPHADQVKSRPRRGSQSSS